MLVAEVHVAGGQEHRLVHPIAVHLLDETGGERQLVAVVVQRQGLQRAERQRPGEVVTPVHGALVAEDAPARVPGDGGDTVDVLVGDVVRTVGGGVDGLADLVDARAAAAQR